ncbi:MAG: hypothetical protein A2Y37_05160 [Spirochaetes bacterium GWB1_60_80]|nr:MAG: hypothetical protein VE99_C0002G0017 [candidate division Kazan bacterium GW2011_GWC1_52_13]OHD16331.1 MAG: hypothetical protein A2Y37_05160 [Spirochaetes bacterium GWB1_60_80]OHD60248.1 MAG: hypothetical protein A2Y32_07400 [Spirochaetes bacterium GWF1_60_12]HAX37598.1 hypothetical protein [Spirochaetaceae bacterium]HBO40982.1 hypothetical protein [Spirochaetaceae bacterium]
MKPRAIFGSLGCACLLFTACQSAWQHIPADTVHELPGVRVIPGGHCESSAIGNALNFLGYPLPEYTITGAGGALGFGLERSAFPFLSARNGDMRERFFAATGIAWERSAAAIDQSDDIGWSQIASLLDQGLPVILRVDMRYLPYLYGGRYGPAHMSFGWHMITLFALDRRTDTALVSDTALPGLQTIALRDLHKARTSTTKVFPPRAEFFWISQRAANYQPDWGRLLDASLDTVCASYRESGLAGLSRYGQDLAELEQYSKQSFLLPAVLEYMAGNIEDFGTGGAAFRMLYREFLARASTELRQNVPERAHRLDTALVRLDQAIDLWHQLSGAMRALAGRIKGLNREERQLEYQNLKKLADQLHETEKAFYNELETCRAEA